MGMKEQLEQFVKQVKEWHQDCRGNEQATKASLIAPLFVILGYNLQDPRECKPEYRADFGKGERAATPVDWAFLINGAFAFFVEAKEAGASITKYAEQLGMYFAKEPGVKLAILTNGVEWQFFTDLDHLHLMDKEPFLTWNVLEDKLIPLDFLKILHKSEFKPHHIKTFAQDKRRRNLLVDELTRLLAPSPEFVKLSVANMENRALDAKVIEEWKPILTNAIQEWVKRRALAMALEAPTARPPGKETVAPDRGTGEERKKRLQQGKKSYEANLQALIGAGLLTPPLGLFRTYNGRNLEATLLPNGQIEFQGVAYDTCSGAAEVARETVTGRRMNTNGWDFWQYRDATGKRLRLASARQQFGKAGTGEEPTNQTDRVTMMQKRILTYLASLSNNEGATRQQLVCVGRAMPFGTSPMVAKFGGGVIGNIRDDNSAHPNSLLARGWIETTETKDGDKTETRLRLTPAGLQAAKENAVELPIDYSSQ